jgi:hypothetical protein
MTPEAIKHQKWCERRKEYNESIRKALYAHGVRRPDEASGGDAAVRIDRHMTDPTVLIVKIPQQKELSSGMLRKIAKAVGAEDYDVRAGYGFDSYRTSMEGPRLVIRFFLSELPPHYPYRGIGEDPNSKIPRPLA